MQVFSQLFFQILGASHRALALVHLAFRGQRGSAVVPVPPCVSNRPVFAPRQPAPVFHLIVSGPVGRRAASRDGGRLKIKVAGTKQHAGD